MTAAGAGIRGSELLGDMEAGALQHVVDKPVVHILRLGKADLKKGVGRWAGFGKLSVSRARV